MSKKRLMTGLQPSGQLHIGNYFGALKPFIDKYEEFDSFLLIVDYHALTTTKNPKELKENILQVAIDYLASGIDPNKVTLFQQSAISEHTELAWIFESLVTVPFLMQAHSYKDKIAKGLEANAGLFNYPMLMASDILIYDIDFVPVGEDQRQHIEYTREVVNKFNNAYGDTFKSPKEIILEETGIIPGIDGQKMSKSYKNTIPLFGTRDEIAKAVMSIVTDSKGGFPEYVYAIHKFFKPEEELKVLYKENEKNYKALKEALIEDIDNFISPMREKRNALEKNQDEVINILKEGAKKAKELAEKKMEDVRTKVGVNIY